MYIINIDLLNTVSLLHLHNFVKLAESILNKYNIILMFEIMNFDRVIINC